MCEISTDECLATMNNAEYSSEVAKESIIMTMYGDFVQKLFIIIIWI